jgi:hypothetical protein
MNAGYNPENISQIKQAAAHAGFSFVLNDQQEEQDEQSAYFFFVGKNDGKEVIFDTFIYTLRAEYELQLHELAESRLLEKFPNLASVDDANEDQLIYFDMLLDDIEQEDEISVVEFINTDEAVDFGVSIDVCLNVDEITPEVIEKFVQDFNADKLDLSDEEYSFSPYSGEEN